MHGWTRGSAKRPGLTWLPAGLGSNDTCSPSPSERGVQRGWLECCGERPHMREHQPQGGW